MGEQQDNKQPNRKFRTTLMIITIVCLIFFILATIFTCSSNGFEKQIVLERDGKTVENMQIKELGLHPGESVDYKVLIKTKATGTYRVSMDFDEIEDGGLKNFIIVTIKSGDTVIYEDGLTQTLSGDNVVFNCDIKANETYVLDIKYLMPIEAGNDAMNTRASFNIEFTIELI